jgi:hypothetical protein
VVDAFAEVLVEERLHIFLANFALRHDLKLSSSEAKHCPDGRRRGEDN